MSGGHHERLAGPHPLRTLLKMGSTTGDGTAARDSDAGIAASIATGDQQAFAQLYERYSDRIYSYCVSVCGNRELAVDAMGDSFLLAFARVGQLRDQSKLRPWLYAIARNECLRQIRSAKRTVDLEVAGEVADMNATADTVLNAADARALIDDAFVGMNTSDREVLDLALRQDLDNASIAAVLGVSDDNAAAKVSRAKSQLEKAVGALMLFRGRASGCTDLDRDIGPDTAFTPLARKRISRHAEDCTQCSKSRAKSVAAIALAGLPLLAASTSPRHASLNSAIGETGGAVSAADADPTPDASVPGKFPPSSEPVYIAESQAQIPPLSMADRAAQLDRSRPAYAKNGWPIAGKQDGRRWPLIVAIAVAIVLMVVVTGLALSPS